MRKESKIYIAGHNGLVGSALTRQLEDRGYCNLITRPLQELNLCNALDTAAFFEKEKPEYVFLAAARVGGIYANNNYPADFIYQNLLIQNNVIHNAYVTGVKKLLFLGSSCIYPRDCPQPIKEEYLLSGPLEPTNKPYAVAKIAGIELCTSYNRQYETNFIACMPTNLYGPQDNFDIENAHVIPALIAKMIHAKKVNASCVQLWGTGNARREFLYSDDLAQALIFLMNSYDDSLALNIGINNDISIKELAFLIKELIEFKGKLVFDTTKPDGTPQKLLDSSRINTLGWRAQTSLAEGLQKTIAWYSLHNS